MAIKNLKMKVQARHFPEASRCSLRSYILWKEVVYARIAPFYSQQMMKILSPLTSVLNSGRKTEVNMSIPEGICRKIARKK